MIVGDSVTQLAIPEIQARLPEASLIARYGFTAEKLLPAVRTTVRNGGVLIFEGGTDDVMLRIPWRSTLATMLTLSRKVPCAWFVTLTEKSLPRAAHAWNQQLRTAKIPVRLIDWNAAVIVKPSLVFDGIHPSATGRAWLANAYARAVRAC